VQIHTPPGGADARVQQRNHKDIFPDGVSSNAADTTAIHDTVDTEFFLRFAGVSSHGFASQPFLFVGDDAQS
jgi:hypothetical protein